MKRPTPTGRAALEPQPMTPDQVADLVDRVRHATAGRPSIARAVARVLRGESPKSAAAAEGVCTGGWLYARIRRARREQAKEAP